MMFDLIIVGAGPIGLACGIEAKKKGLSYLILEKGVLANSLYHYPQNMTFFSTADRLEIGEVPFISQNLKPTRKEALEYYYRVATAWKLKLHLYEEVLNINPLKPGYEVLTTKAKYIAKSLIFATGFYDIPYPLNVPGEDLLKVKHYYDEPYPYYRQKVMVVGAANSAVDVALETYRKGAEVTMLIREEAISSSVKYWVKPDIENRIKEGAIRAYFQSSITEIREQEVDIRTPDGLLTLENDFVLAMTGYQINYSFLERIGIAIQEDEMRTPVYNPDTMETNLPQVYLAGVVCGGLKTNKWFIENSRVHAEIILSNIENTKN